MVVGHLFEIMHDCIKTPGDGVIRFQGMQDSSAKDSSTPLTAAADEETAGPRFRRAV
ncbi:MAG: hypothetical protein IPN75_06735 [Dechloromonas sp.]|jgi:hypothetical protein|uniref:Uncharacterized protein n=1 Tax=Candidatus Dechloromonas phosphorivorans TaxID=2899244 RepID=A0A9D7QKX0_9RHOO|nr:hypothetical protein [Candidatus Dechloromonas phosphorivorans]